MATGHGPARVIIAPQSGAGDLPFAKAGAGAEADGARLRMLSMGSH
jgi:hypothetical protein